MKNLSFAVSALAILGLATTPVAAQTRASHAVNPSLSLSSPATTPLQQQIQEDYATSLVPAQRQLLQHNPSATAGRSSRSANSSTASLPDNNR
jgi:hypothetical protein